MVSSKISYAHLPKTGGQFVRSVIKALDANIKEIGDYHSPPAVLYKHGFIAKVLVTIRHPISWYRSRWYHRVRNGWAPMHPVDWECANNDFNKFVNNVIDYDDNGRLSTLTKLFIMKNKFDQVEFVIKNEQLKQDLYDVLVKVGFEVDRSFYDSLSNVNVAGRDEKSSTSVAVYDDSTLNRMMEKERWLIDNFYS